MDLVIKDGSGGSGHAHKRADSEKFFPTKMRITVIQVSAGSKYDPGLVPNLPRKSGVEVGKESAIERGFQHIEEALIISRRFSVRSRQSSARRLSDAKPQRAWSGALSFFVAAQLFFKE